MYNECLDGEIEWDDGKHEYEYYEYKNDDKNYKYMKAKIHRDIETYKGWVKKCVHFDNYKCEGQILYEGYIKVEEDKLEKLEQDRKIGKFERIYYV